MRRLRDLLPPTSKAKYLVWRVLGSRFALSVRLRTGERLIIRAAPCTDISTAYEIFVAEAYRPVGSGINEAASRIVDVGANVGFSVLYWATRYPNAGIVAFEPHPAHLQQLDQHVRLNGLTERVEIVSAAVAAQAGSAHLTNEA